MKLQLMHCTLRFATLEGYDSLSSRTRKSVVERSVEEYPLDEPIGAAHQQMAPAAVLQDCADAGSYRLQHSDIGRIRANPLSEEPHPTLVATVRRFGITGLIAGALGTALLRWWRAVTR
jgi:hypothetical protein